MLTCVVCIACALVFVHVELIVFKNRYLFIVGLTSYVTFC